MIVAFLDCALDRGCFELRRKGRLVKVEPKVFDVLVHLIEHRERVVSKRELLDTLWPGEAVSDSVLPRCIAAARRATGDTRAKQRVIQTAHGRGYRFVAQVDEAAEVSSATEIQAAASPLRSAPRPGSEGSAEVPGFVGRADALRRFDAALTNAEGLRPAVVLLVGEPGIGKTATSDECARRARARGFELLAGRCYEGEGAPPYWPWLQILRSAAAHSDDVQLLAQLGTGGGDLVALAPELGERFSQLQGAPGPLGEQARFRLYDAATRFFSARAADAPLLLVLDDLHWADASSLGLLTFLVEHVAERALLVIGTYRDVDVRRGHPLSDSLGVLARTAHCERIALSGLGPAEIEVLVAPQLAGPGREIGQRAAGLAEQLHAMTEGNPFFVREIIRWLAERGELEAAEAETLDPWTLPQGVRDAIGRRLDQLSPECNEMLRAAAVIGREFSVAVLLPVLEESGESAESAMELLGEALDLAVIGETGPGRYAFGHALTRQTLYEELRAPQRIALHRRVGRALEAAASVGPQGERLAELAHHHFEAAPGGDVEKAVASCEAAAAYAHDHHAYDEAVELRRRALEACDSRIPSGSAGRERRAELMLALGEELFTAGAREAARTQLHATAEQAREVGRADLVAGAAIAIRGYGETGIPPADRDRQLLEQTLAGLPTEALALRARLVARLSSAMSESMHERRVLADQALALARECDDPAALQDALGARWWATLGPDAVGERRAIAAELRALAERTPDPRVQLLSLECELGAALLLGEREAIEASISEYRELAAAIRQPVFLFLGEMMLASWMMSCGDFEEAERRLTELREFGRGRVPFAEVNYLGMQFWSRTQRGGAIDLEAASAALSASLGDFYGRGPLTRMLSAISGASHGLDEGGLRARVEAVDVASLERDEHWLLVMGALSDMAYDLADRELMQLLYARLEPYGELMAVHDLLRALSGSVSAILGELATGLGRCDEAVAHYQRALGREAAAGLRPAVVASELGLARALLGRARPGDAQVAAQSVARARALEAEIGTAYCQRMAPQLEALQAR